MCNYIWKYRFKVEHLLTKQSVKDKNMEFESPHFPKTEKDKDYTEGKVTIELDNLASSSFVQEVVIKGLELVFALNNHSSFPIEISIVESPPGPYLPMELQAKIRGHQISPLKEAESMPNLWSKYLKLLKSNHQELRLSICWFMRAIKSEDPIDKFIYSWITFNMLYSWLTGVPGDDHRKGIKGLIGKGIPHLKKQNEIILEHKEILKELSRMKLIDRNKVDRAENLRNALPGQIPKEILEGTIEAIGFIRHNIFHGSLEDRTTEAERCIWPLIHLDSEIIKHQLDRV